MSTSATKTEDVNVPGLSDYEKRRLENIKRNNARLRSLGLISALEEKRSNAIAEGIELYERSDSEDEDNSDDEEWNNETHGKGEKKHKKKKRVSSKKEPVEGGRKSLRLQGIGVDLQVLPEKPTDRESIMKEREERVTESDRESIMKEREERVTECREVRLRAAKAVAECGAEAAAQENPTATYEHCLMRVQSMTHKGLANRVKAIERAAGKHCVVKMAIFKSCLQDEGMWELSELASEALERLKGLQAIPEKCTTSTCN